MLQPHCFMEEPVNKTLGKNHSPSQMQTCFLAMQCTPHCDSWRAAMKPDLYCLIPQLSHTTKTEKWTCVWWDQSTRISTQLE